MGSPAPHLLVTPSLRLVSELSQGTMGSVWIAEHLTLKTQFAVKFISPGLIEADPTALVRFTNEARAMASIRSPHVVSTSDYGVTDEGEPFIVMDLLEGETLRDRLKREGPLSIETVAVIVAQVARGLAAAHVEGILHRDIKPENVFLVEGDEPPLVKLIDFGLAKLTMGDTSLMPTQAGARVGTPAFMSPEQILAEDIIDHRADLWGAAVVAYHALTRKHPFRGESVDVFLDNIRARVYTPATEHRPELPAAVDVWFRKALEPDPDNRFQSAIELSDALTEALGVADDLPPFPVPRTSYSGFRSVSLTDEHEPIPSQRPSAELVALQRQMQRRTQFLVALCIVLAIVAIVLALR